MELASLALPMVKYSGGAGAVYGALCHFVTPRMMGKNYDAAVLAAGHCGFGLPRQRNR